MEINGITQSCHVERSETSAARPCHAERVSQSPERREGEGETSAAHPCHVERVSRSPERSEGETSAARPCHVERSETSAAHPCHVERSETSAADRWRPFAEFPLSEANGLRMTSLRIHNLSITIINAIRKKYAA